MVERKQYNGIDLIKFIMAIFVVMVHLTPFSIFGDKTNFIVQAIVRIAVPFFFCASGFFLRRKLDVANNKNECCKVVVEFTKRVLSLYALWSIIYIPCIAFWYKANGETIFSFIQKCIFDGSYLHLWYLPSLVIAGLLVTFAYLKIGTVKTTILAGIIYIIGLLDNGYYGLAEIIGIKGLINSYDKIFLTTRNGLFFGFIFMGLGFLAYEYKINMKFSIIFFVVSEIIMLVEMYVIYASGIVRTCEADVFLMASTFFLFQISKNLELKNKNIYKNLRTIGVLVYFAHCWVDFTWSILCYNIVHRTFNNMYRFIYTITITLLIAFLIDRLKDCDRFKWMRKLY